MENAKTDQKERLQQLSMKYGMTLRDLARMAQMSEATLYHITDESRRLTPRTAARICYYMEKEKGVVVNRQWLLTGEGEMIEEKSSQPYGNEAVATTVIAAEEREVEVNYKEKYLALLEEYSRLQKEHSELLKRLLK